MDNKYHDKLIVSSAPHAVGPISTQKIMGLVLVALIPAFISGIYQFGYRAAVLTIVCVIACVVFEYLMNVILKKKQTVGDLSAVLTGVLLAFNLPSGLPYWIAIVGCFAAIVVVKQLFGGIGQNLVNPAVTARIFLFIAFATEMTTWPTARGAGVDAVTSATPLGELGMGGPEAVTASNMDLFLGNVGGCIGEVSALALLLGLGYMLWKKIISWHIPVSILGTVLVFAGLMHLVNPVAYASPLAHLFTGGLMLGAIFMATDYVTSPMTHKGMIIYGVAIGFLTVVIRNFGAYPEGMSFAIFIMNAFTPLINTYCKPKRFGEVKK